MKFGLREMIFLGVLMILPVAAWWFDFRPRNKHNADMLEQIQAKQSRLQELNRVTAQLGDLKQEIADLEEAIGFFESKLPSEKEIDKVLKEVWKTAEENDLTAKSIRTSSKTHSADSFTNPGGPHAEQPIVMVLQGDFMGFYAFLQALERQPRIMRIASMTLTKPEKKDLPEGTMEAEIELSVFFETESPFARR